MRHPAFARAAALGKTVTAVHFSIGSRLLARPVVEVLAHWCSVAEASHRLNIICRCALVFRMREALVRGSWAMAVCGLSASVAFGMAVIVPAAAVSVSLFSLALLPFVFALLLALLDRLLVDHPDGVALLVHLLDDSTKRLVCVPELVYPE